jgi:hypothetical protein
VKRRLSGFVHLESEKEAHEKMSLKLNAEFGIRCENNVEQLLTDCVHKVN